MFTLHLCISKYPCVQILRQISIRDITGLVESYRNYNDRVCHRTMLNAGYLDELNTDQLNLIQKYLQQKFIIITNHYLNCLILMMHW